MKKVLLFAILACFCSVALCQNGALLASTDNEPSIRGFNENVVVYSVGEPVLGYPLVSKSIPEGFVTTKDKCPILQYYVKVKKDFIGKKIIFESSKDTLIIKNLKFVEEPVGFGTLIFDTNKKKLNFSSDFGYILVENKEMIYLGMICEKEKNFYKILMK